METKKINPLNVDSSIQKLVEEAKSLFSIFDSISASVCKFEQDLNNARAYFPYKSQAIKVEVSHKKNPETYHKDIGYEVLGYYTKTHWYLSWESDENSKNFRLFLIAEEKEIILFMIPDEERCGEMEFQTKNIFKKPLMETNLSIKLQYSECLIPFIDSFTDYLQKRRIIIEQGGLPF